MDATSNAGFCAVCAILNAATPFKAVASTNARRIVLMRMWALHSSIAPECGSSHGLVGSKKHAPKAYDADLFVQPTRSLRPLFFGSGQLRIYECVAPLLSSVHGHDAGGYEMRVGYQIHGNFIEYSLLVEARVYGDGAGNLAGGHLANDEVGAAFQQAIQGAVGHIDILHWNVFRTRILEIR